MPAVAVNAMAKRLLTNVGFLLLINLLIKPLFIFGIDIPVQNRVGTEAYGFYFALFNFAFLFNVILDFGINNFNQRLVARNPDRVRMWLPNIVLVKLFLALIFYALVFVLAVGLQFDRSQLAVLGWISVNRILVSFHMYFRSNVSGLQAFRADAVLSIMDRLLTILLIGALLYTNVLGRAFQIQDFVIGTTIALSLTAAISFIVLRIKSGPIGLSWNSRLFKVILKRAYPFAMLGVLMTLYNRIDGVMIERLLGDEGDREAGVYAAAYRLLDAATMFAFLISGILLPLFARMIKQGKDIWPVLRMSGRLMFAVSATGVAVGLVFSGPIIQGLYTEADARWASIFGLLIFGFLFNSAVYVYGSLLTADGQLKGLNWIALSGVLLNIVLNLILIPAQGAYGAAIATVATQGLAAAANIIYAGWLYGLGRQFNAEAPTYLALLLILAGAGYGSTLISLDWRLAAILLASIGGIASIALKLIDLGQLRSEFGLGES